MATRSNIDFYTAYPSSKDRKEKTKLVARIYKHWDGYPENMVPLFKKFRKEMLKHFGDNNPEAAGYGHLINSGEDLAAQFVKMFMPKFGDISVCLDLHQDIEYLYELHSWYGLDGIGNWKLKIYEVDNWDNAGNKKLIKTITLK